jgi:flagellar hook-associated protein 1 FlgK
VGLEGYSSVTSSGAVSDPSTILQAAGLPFAVQAGSFRIRLTDSEGNELDVYEIAVDPSTDSLAEIAARIDASDGQTGAGPVRASVDSSGRLSISTEGDQRLTFQEDTSHFLSSIGNNNLFEGFDAGSIGVSQALLDNPALIAASTTGEPGGSEAARAIAGLRDLGVLDGGRTSLLSFYQTLTADLGGEAQRAAQLESNSDLLLQSLHYRQEELSGVNVDEEAVEMMKYQRCFQAAARLITAADEMMATIIERTGLAGR